MEEPIKNSEQYNGHAVIFVHIPKTAGTTLSRVLKRQYQSETIYSIDGSRVTESVDEFKNLPETQRGKIRVLKGHFGFGLHDVLPRPSTYITILRDPVDRIISHYYFVSRRPDHYLHKALKSRGMSFEDYLYSGISIEIDNGQTRQLAGWDTSIGFGQCSAELLERAKKNLQNYFAVAGLSERFDETLILLKTTFGWRMPFYVKRNVTRKRPRRHEISEETVKYIEERNSLDIDTYRYAKERFEDLITKTCGSFERDLKVFLLLNKPYGAIYSSFRRCRGKLLRAVQR